MKQEIKEYLSAIGSQGGKIGGKSKTDKKRASSKANLLKARLALKVKTLACQANAKKPRPNRKKKKKGE